MGTPHPRRQAHPLTVTELEQPVSTIDPGTAIGALYRSVILLGYASALRPGELSALDIADIIAKPAGLLVAVRRAPRPTRTITGSSSASPAASTAKPIPFGP